MATATRTIEKKKETNRSMEETEVRESEFKMIFAPTSKKKTTTALRKIGSPIRRKSTFQRAKLYQTSAHEYCKAHKQLRCVVVLPGGAPQSPKNAKKRGRNGSKSKKTQKKGTVADHQAPIARR